MNCYRKRIFLFFLLCSISLVAYADVMQQRRITISASIFPRIIAVDSELSSKLDEKGNVRLGIIYYTDLKGAKKIAKSMTRKIKNISGNNIIIDFISFENTKFENKRNLSGIFISQEVSDLDLTTIKSYANNRHIIYFSPFKGDVERGVMAGIFIGAKIRPYFNLTSIGNAKVLLKPAIIKVSKTYE